MFDAELLDAHLIWVREHSPFFRELWKDVWAEGGTVPVLQTLPLTEHEGYWQANAPHAHHLLTGSHTDGIVFKSGGTTGNPKYSFFSNADWETFCRVFGQGMRRGGLKAGDRVANVFYGGQLYASLLFIGRSIEACGCGVHFPLAGFAPAEDIVDALAKFEIDTLAGVPTTIMNLLPTMAGRRDELCLRRILFGGEAMYPDQVAELKKMFPDSRVQSIGIAGVDYGEMGWVDESCEAGVHRVYDESTVLELLDEGGHPLHESGDEGALCITNYRRRLMPVIRYAVGDRGRWMDPPGTPGRRFKVLGRTDKGARVGPMTLYLEDIQRILEAHVSPGAFGTFQLVVDHTERRDRCVLRISCATIPSSIDTLNETLTAALYRERSMFPDLIRGGIVHPLAVEWVALDQLETSPRTGKLMRLVDRRAV